MWVTLTPKARMGILINQLQEFFKFRNFRQWSVNMPLQVGPHPINLPNILGLYIGCFCNRMLHFFFRVSPNGPNLENLDTLAFYSESQIQFWSNMEGWPPFLNEGGDQLLVFLHFNFSECHRLSHIRAGLTDIPFRQRFQCIQLGLWREEEVSHLREAPQYETRWPREF